MRTTDVLPKQLALGSRIIHSAYFHERRFAYVGRPTLRLPPATARFGRLVILK
jgi:hypothetical protein